MRKWMTLTAGLIAGVLLSTALFVVAAPSGAPVPAHVGIVDFNRLLDKYDKMKDSEKEINAVHDRITDESKTRQAALQQLQAKLQMHTPGSEAYTATEKEITTKTAEFETWTKLKVQELMQREHNCITGIYTDVENAAAEYAKANGLTLVLKTDKIDLSSPSERELDFRMALKQILYSSEEMDITENLVGTLNARYAKQKGLEGAVKGATK